MDIEIYPIIQFPLYHAVVEEFHSGFPMQPMMKIFPTWQQFHFNAARVLGNVFLIPLNSIYLYQFWCKFCGKLHFIQIIPAYSYRNMNGKYSDSHRVWTTTGSLN